jgi:hypothetical protein
MFMICNQDSTGISQNAKWKHEESQEQTERPFPSVNQNKRRWCIITLATPPGNRSSFPIGWMGRSNPKWMGMKSGWKLQNQSDLSPNEPRAASAGAKETERGIKNEPQDSNCERNL